MMQNSYLNRLGISLGRQRLKLASYGAIEDSKDRHSSRSGCKPISWLVWQWDAWYYSPSRTGAWCGMR